MDYFSEALHLLSSKYGETGEECAEAYLCYGEALLEVARMERSVLANALEGVEEDVEEERINFENVHDEGFKFKGVQLEEVKFAEGQVEDVESLNRQTHGDVEDLVAEALEENCDLHDKIARLHISQVSESSEESEKLGECSDMDNYCGAEEMEKSEASLSKVVDLSEEEAVDDLSDLQLSWEVLEMARIIYTRIAMFASGEEKLEAEIKLSEALLLLGQVSLEAGHYQQAVEDLVAAHEKMKDCLPEESRRIAEVLYHKGEAEALLGRFDQAEGSLNLSFGVLEKRIRMHPEEGEEIKSIVVEIKEVVEEHREMKRNSAEVSGLVQ